MRRLPLFAALLLGLAGCDFTPVLDVATPDFQPGLVLSGALVADSTVLVRVGFAEDPYDGVPDPTLSYASLAVTLWRDGAAVEALVSAPCRRLDNDGTPLPGVDCGRYVGQTVVAAGATYEIRAEAPGLPPAVATVTVPPRPAVTAATALGAGTLDGQPADRVTLTLDDPPGPHRYYLDVAQTVTVVQPVYGPTGPTGRDTVVTFTADLSYTTTTPVLVAAALYVPLYGITHVLFEDRLFDGSRWSASLDVARPIPQPDGGSAGPRRLRLFSVDALVAESYLRGEFSTVDSGDNPFVEPSNAPSNVTGGYGLVAGVALTEVPLPDPAP